MSKVEMISPEYKEQIIKQAEKELQDLNDQAKNKKKKLSTKDQLHREYMRTLVQNPSPLNILFCLSGRFADMKRKEEESV